MSKSTEITFDVLDNDIRDFWTAFLEHSNLAKTVRAGTMNRRYFAIYMFETYHYTSHNARNQALVGVRDFINKPQYLKFCFEHALEETGHELMALHDVNSLGLKDRDYEIPKPLPATEIFIAYLYYISATGNPLQRLGYSYWAESVYEHVMPLIRDIQTQLQLKDSQLTFFISHALIDEGHAEEVKDQIRQHVSTQQDWQDLRRVLKTTLELTARVIEEVHQTYLKLDAGEATGYEFLNQYLDDSK